MKRLWSAFSLCLLLLALPLLLGQRAEALETGGTENRWRLLERDGIAIDLIECLDPENGDAVWLFGMLCQAKNVWQVEIKDIMLNGAVRSNDGVFFSIEEGKEQQYKCPDVLNDEIVLAGGSALRSVTCNVRAWSTEKKQMFTETVTVELPTDRHPDIVMVPFRGVWAEEQVLSEEPPLRVTLLGCGDVLTDERYSTSFCGVLRLENLSGRTLRVDGYGLSVNGLYYDGYAQAGITLPEGGSYLWEFQLHESDLKKMEIAEIRSLRLLLFIDENGESQIKRDGRNDWYDIRLEGTRYGVQPFDEGRIVYRDGNIRIGYRGCERKELWSGGVELTWKLSIINDSDVSFSLRLFKPSLSEEAAASYYFLSPQTIGAHTKRYFTITTDSAEPSDLTFSLRVRTRQGEKLLFTVKDLVLSPAEP